MTKSKNQDLKCFYDFFLDIIQTSLAKRRADIIRTS